MRGWSLLPVRENEQRTSACFSAAGGTPILRTVLTNPEPAKQVRLTPRERQVLGLLAQGSRGPELARSLGLSVDTVRTHVRNAMQKLEARTRTQAVAMAVEAGTVTSRQDSEDVEAQPPV
jgi:DNA-binding NarL/FixJ family response regulator